jgi:predicted tellurium resistance membrane protein TerC
LLERFKFIAYVGLILIVYIGGKLLFEGIEIANATLGLGLPVGAPH